jgi:hypothetical protein
MNETILDKARRIHKARLPFKIIHKDGGELICEKVRGYGMHFLQQTASYLKEIANGREQKIYRDLILDIVEIEPNQRYGFIVNFAKDGNKSNRRYNED